MSKLYPKVPLTAAACLLLFFARYWARGEPDSNQSAITSGWLIADLWSRAEFSIVYYQEKRQYDQEPEIRRLGLNLKPVGSLIKIDGSERHLTLPERTRLQTDFYSAVRAGLGVMVNDAYYNKISDDNARRSLVISVTEKSLSLTQARFLGKEMDVDLEIRKFARMLAAGHQALLAWASVPRYISVKGTEEEIRRQELRDSPGQGQAGGVQTAVRAGHGRD